MQIVTTSHLSIKMINADGSPGSYDSGAHGILSPYLGIPTLWPSIFVASSKSVIFSGDSYLPHAKAHRVMLCPDGPDTGFVASFPYENNIDQKGRFIKVLSSPRHPPGKSPSILEPYSIVRMI